MTRFPILLASLAAAALPSRASAQSGAGTADPSSVAAEPLRLRLELASSSLDAVSLRTEIERELNRPVSLVRDEDAPLSVRVTDDGRLRLSYTEARAGRVERNVDLPQDPNRAREVVALLVGNVVRDEAGELLRTLEASSADIAAVPEPEPEPEAPSVAPPLPPPPPPPPPEPPPKPQSRHDWLGLRSRFDSLAESPVKFNLSVAHPLTLLRDTQQRRLNLELGLFYSDVGAIEGVGLNFGVLSVRHHLRGVALGALYNHVGGSTRGVSMSFLYDGGAGHLEGLGFAGVLAFRKANVSGAHAGLAVAVAKDVAGAQAAGAVSVSKRLEGATAAGALNIVQGELHGAAAAGGVNVLGSVRGAALSGAANVTGDAQGLLAAGGANVARDVGGVSIALINVARKVEGLQLGLINVASEVDGASLGLISVAGNGRVQPVFYGSTSMPLHAGVKFVAGYAYSEVGFAYAPRDEKQSLELGGGLHIPAGTVYFEPGVHFSETDAPGDTSYEAHGDLHHRLRVGLRLFDRMDVFAGGGVLQGIQGQTKDEIRAEGFAGIAVF